MWILSHFICWKGCLPLRLKVGLGLRRCQALAYPYFRSLAKVEREPTQPVTKMEFEFERRITKEDIRELIYREILESYPNMLKEYLDGTDSAGFMYPSAVDQFEEQFAYLEEHYGNGATVALLERPCVLYSDNSAPNSAEVADGFPNVASKKPRSRYLPRVVGPP